MNNSTGRRKASWSIVVSSLLLLCACQSRNQSASESGSEDCLELASLNQLDQRCAIQIAQNEIMKREGQDASSYSKFEARFDESSATWAITAIYKPETPGGHLFIAIGRDGRVLDYLPGE